MAKKQTESDIRRQHVSLQEAVDVLQVKRKLIVGFLETHEFAALLAKYEAEIEAYKEHNTDRSLDGKATTKLRADIWARRDFLKQLREAHKEDLEQAQTRLQEFEKQHPLLLQPQPKKRAKGQGKT